MSQVAVGAMSNKSGLCCCGCGAPTKIATTTHRHYGIVKGLPLRFLPGHQSRKSPNDYVEEDRGHETACWVWQRAANDQGYGQVFVNGSIKYAHRFFYERAFGAVPEGLELDHCCRVTLCVNPAHLEPVSHRENMRRGRSTKLTEEVVREIRRLAKSGMSQRAIARAYGLDHGWVSRIVRRIAWSDVV